MKINNKGISLIVLVITIIVIVILAGAVILGLSNNNPISQATKATFLSDVSNFQAELTLYETKQFADEMGAYNPTLLQADETSVTYNGNIDTSKTMYDLIPTLGKATRYAGQFAVVDGKLIFQGSDTKKQDWSRESGMEVVIAGEPKVTIVPPMNTVVIPGTDIVYTIKFTSNLALTIIDLTNKVEVLDNNGVALSTQPVITIGTVSGTNLDAARQVDVTIKTNTLVNGAYKLKIKSGSVTNADNISISQDTISLIGFDIDNVVPTNPVISASPSEWTNGNVTVTINYSVDSTVKEYSLDSTNWNTYTSPIVVTTNNTTIYARGKDTAGNVSGLATITVTNIDKTTPTVVYGTDGGTSVTASTTVTVSDVGGSAINTSTLQYVWDTQNVTAPSTGWTAFTNGATITKTGEGTYYLWIKASDNAGNVLVSKTSLFTLILPTPTDFTYNASYQTWTAPSTGTYQLEVWGAQGGNSGGNGGYSSGTINLVQGQSVYIYLGGVGNSSSAGTYGNSGQSVSCTGGFNGGGNGNAFGFWYATTNWTYGRAGGGGGATDIRLNGTAISNRIIVAGGGGGRVDYNNKNTNQYFYAGFAGGGLTDTSGTTTQTTGYVLGLGGSASTGANTGGGGGGYYGGTIVNGSGAHGGSGYIGGVQNGTTTNGDSSMPNPSGGTMTGNTGNGRARITLVN